MATRLYAMTANGAMETVIEGVGVANSAGIINLSIDLATSVADGAGGTRAITKAEVIEGLDVLMQYIVRSNWTPA